MSLPKRIATVAICIFSTMLTRFLPFLTFSSKRPTSKTVQYLGEALPCAVFGPLMVCYLKHVSVFSGTHGIPEFIVIAVTAALRLWKKQMLLSITAGTVVYILLPQLVFQPKRKASVLTPSVHIPTSGLHFASVHRHYLCSYFKIYTRFHAVSNLGVVKKMNAENPQVFGMADLRILF